MEDYAQRQLKPHQNSRERGCAKPLDTPVISCGLLFSTSLEPRLHLASSSQAEEGCVEAWRTDKEEVAMNNQEESLDKDGKMGCLTRKDREMVQAEEEVQGREQVEKE
ncbi:hypothetical protein SRHO_G00301170 [Serrasalmus rhombeus]